ncbi:MAG: DUF5615 family PIN-like protein [Phycisphaerales bacterium]
MLLDHCVPKAFARCLVGHDVQTCRQMGWQDLSNGRLIAAASGEFDVLVTVDQGFAHQQHAAELPLPVILIETTDTRVPAMLRFGPPLLNLLTSALATRLIVVRETDRAL